MLQKTQTQYGILNQNIEESYLLKAGPQPAKIDTNNP